MIKVQGGLSGRNVYVFKFGRSALERKWMEIVDVIARNLGEICDFIVFVNIVMRLIQCEEHSDKWTKSKSNTPIWYG